MGERVVVPAELQPAVMRLLHQAHQGMVKMKAVARSFVWWPGLDNEIEEACRECRVCQLVQRAPPRATVIPWSPPDRPWSRIHVDFAGPVQGRTLLIVVCAYSKWIEVADTRGSMSAGTTIAVLRKLFACHGLPDVVVSDNGPCFKSAEFADFMRENLVQHHLTAPYHPASNGLAERAVQTVKSMLAKHPVSEWDCELPALLLTLHSTPSSSGLTPAEMMFNRRIRTLLDKMHPLSAAAAAQLKREEVVADAVQHDGRGDRLGVGAAVWFRNYGMGKPAWLHGQIVKVKGPRNFTVRSDKGDILSERHLDQLRRGHTGAEQIIGAGGSDNSGAFSSRESAAETAAGHAERPERGRGRREAQQSTRGLPLSPPVTRRAERASTPPRAGSPPSVRRTPFRTPARTRPTTPEVAGGRMSPPRGSPASPPLQPLPPSPPTPPSVLRRSKRISDYQASPCGRKNM